MNKLKCQNEKCIQLDIDNEEDIRLILNIEEGTRHQYYINSDGSLEHYDSDGTEIGRASCRERVL